VHGRIAPGSILSKPGDVGDACGSKDGGAPVGGPDGEPDGVKSEGCSKGGI